LIKKYDYIILKFVNREKNSVGIGNQHLNDHIIWADKPKLIIEVISGIEKYWNSRINRNFKLYS